jgi:hypothetical protein
MRSQSTIQLRMLAHSRRTLRAGNLTVGHTLSRCLAPPPAVGRVRRRQCRETQSPSRNIVLIE